MNAINKNPLALNPPQPDRYDDYRILRLVDFNKKYHESPHKIVLSYIDFTTPNYADGLNKELYSYGGELNFIATCECGEVSGNINIGAVCKSCKTEVKSQIELGSGEIPHSTWITFPDSVPGVLHPVFYNILSAWLSCGQGKQNNYIDIILDPKRILPSNLEGVITGRGFKYFYENFDKIMLYFFNNPPAKGPKAKSKARAKRIKLFVKKYRKLAFVQYLPALSSVLHPVTAPDNSGKRKYADKGSQYILEAVHILSYLRYYPNKTKRFGEFDHKCMLAYRAYITYIADITKDRLSSKKSLLRKHLFGMRFHWSFRALIVPSVGVHRYDELEFPWVVAVNLLRVHIIGRLINNYNHSPHEAINRQMMARAMYDPIIDEIMNDFIKESPWPGLPVILGRNPSIRRGALQLRFITKIKTSVYDKTIGLSVLALRAYNADFDGDELHGVLLLENQMVRKTMKIHPSQMYTSMNGPGIGTDITLPHQTSITWNSFLGRL